MMTLVRIGLTCVTLVSTNYFVYWLGFSLIRVDRDTGIDSFVSLLCGICAAWFVWKKIGSAPRMLTTSVLLGAVLGGAIGFFLGFFGPILLAPDANQGPLLGIFITGPGGIVLGAIGGLVHGLNRRAMLARQVDGAGTG